MYCTKDKMCAHGRKNSLTCYTMNELRSIVNIINVKEGRTLHFETEKGEKSLWKDIFAYMKSKYGCGDELCWVEKLELKELEKSAFKPKLPSEWLTCNASMAPNNNCMNTWLSNLDIDEVMNQFEKNVPHFDYLGAVPIDFANFSDKKVNEFNIKTAIQNKKTKIGIVFNTDPSYRSGQHWICAFIDLEKKEINYFDSYGKGGIYPKEIEQLFERIVQEGKALGIDLTIKRNTTRHQYKNSECGVYCMKFIADRLNFSFEDIVKEDMPDDKVTIERWKRFFRSEQCRPH